MEFLKKPLKVYNLMTLKIKGTNEGSKTEALIEEYLNNKKIVDLKKSNLKRFIYSICKENHIEIKKETPVVEDTRQSEIEIKPKVDNLGRSYATGRRKDSTARVWVKKGNGEISINGKKMNEYFFRPVLQMQLNHVFEIAKRQQQFDVIATVKGGGLSGQAGAVRHGISKALSFFEPELRSSLKAAGLLTRDSRTVERKKYGKAKARKSFQFSKR